MRLIDADALRKDYIERQEIAERFSLDEFRAFCVTLGLLDRQPTIDAEPVRHGTWEEIETYAFVGFDGKGNVKERRKKYYRHSCGRCSAIKENFCPNCGAIMSGGPSNA